MYVSTVQRQAPMGPPATLTELRFQSCMWCSTVSFRTCLLCPTCSSTALKWERSLGTGKVCSAVEVRKKGQRRRMVAIIQLEGGVRMRGMVEGVSAGEVVPFGAGVTVVAIAEDGVPVFRLDPVRSALRDGHPRSSGFGDAFRALGPGK
ncbi:Zn-ribbon domain-containing OB-fold protein [Streptomyces sp. NPDC056938]|uniref:Zn-ribbon domain-containing OB-fold protein n=1 Tax=unclassified Streptomyces TaxID=2593676 RepID=UPI0036343141